MYKVSIVIPMYNEQRYIGRCLESISQQSFKDFEVILIDDGSKDETVKIAQWFNDRFPLTILQQKNSGPGKARNRWAKEAQWEIIVLVDADMYFDKEFLKNLIAPILNWEEIGTAHGVEKVGNPENIRAKTRCLDRIPNVQERCVLYRAILKSEFLKNWWYDSSKGYFDDNLSHINEGKWALTVMEAICYHNNPSTLLEAFKHSMWVGRSFVQDSTQIIEYSRRYKNILLFLLLIIIAWIIILYKTKFNIANLAYIMLWTLILFLEYLAYKRIKKEKDVRYIRSFPILAFARWWGYIYWIIRYLLIKK